MSDNMESGSDLGVGGGPANGVCPRLGWYVDAETHHAYPSAANQCHTQNPPLTIELAYQASTCLEGDWPACPRFKAAQAEGVVEKPATIPWLGRTNGRSRRLPGWAIAALAITAVAVIAGLFLLFGPVPGLTGSATPAKATALAQTSATSVASKTSTEAAKPTASLASAQSPTETPFPAQTSSPTPLPSSTETEVPSATPSLTPSPRPTETARATAISRLGTGTPGSTSVTGQTATATTPPTATATPTLEPTATPTPLPPTSTARPSARPTSPPPSPTPKPTLGPQFPAPRLLSPADGQVFSARDRIILSWEPVGTLAFDEYYEIALARTHYGIEVFDDTPWIASNEPTSWDMSEHRYLLDLSDDGKFRWAVRVMRRTGINDKGRPEGNALSPLSKVRTLEWKRSSGGGGSSGTPEPPPP